MDHLIDLIQIPKQNRGPLPNVLRRISLAIALVAFVALVVLVNRNGYADHNTGTPIGVIDALYYASVTVTTTGYGDITAISAPARFWTITLITPARIIFLILVVSTTVEVLTEQSKRLILTRRWRKTVKDHTIICGFGATGTSAAVELLNRGAQPSSIVVVDPDQLAVDNAKKQKFVAIKGDATHNSVLDQAGIKTAKNLIITTHDDAVSVLVTLTARDLNKALHVIALGHERENLHLFKNAGANQVVDSTNAVGRLLSLATQAPQASDAVHDLLDAAEGLSLREISPQSLNGKAVLPQNCRLIAIIRDGHRLALKDTDATAIKTTDRLIVAQEL